MAAKLQQRCRAARFPRDPRQRVFTDLDPKADLFDCDDASLALLDYFPPVDADAYPE